MRTKKLTNRGYHRIACQDELAGHVEVWYSNNDNDFVLVVNGKEHRPLTKTEIEVVTRAGQDVLSMEAYNAIPDSQ